MRVELLLIVLLVASAGCTNFLPTGNPINVQKVDTIEDTKDMLSFKNIQTIPRSPIQAGRAMTLSFLVQNNDELEQVKNVKIDLYDAPTFHATNKGEKQDILCNALTKLPTTKEYRACQAETDDSAVSFHSCSGVELDGKELLCPFQPSEQKLFTYKLIAPDTTEINRISTDLSLKLLASYEFESKLNMVVPIINYDEMIRRQQEGTADTVNLVTTHGPGPIIIDGELLGENYILADQESIISFSLRDVGSGALAAWRDENEIRNIQLEITFPTEFEILETPEGFSPPPSYDLLNKLQTKDIPNSVSNMESILMFKDKTQNSINIKVKLRDAVAQEFRDQRLPFRSYTITAKATYVYEIRDAIDVTIKPIKTV